MKSTNRSGHIKITTDGEGLVSHAGALLIVEVAEKVGLSDGLGEAVADTLERKPVHDRGKALTDIAVAIVDGADCLTDVEVLGEQTDLHGSVASNSTMDRILSSIGEKELSLMREARAQARRTAWTAGARPKHLILDMDATPIESYSEKEDAAGHYKGGFGFNPILIYLDETEESLAGALRPGNASPGKAEDHIALLDQALAQLPQDALDEEILVRSDSAGFSHDFVEHLRDTDIRYSIGCSITESIRDAILKVPDDHWIAARTQEGDERKGAQVVELDIDLAQKGWPEGIRAICRRERPHPGAQLSFTDDDGYRFQVFVTDQKSEDIAGLECLHRAHARIEDRIRCAKEMGLRGLPCYDFQKNKVWFELSLIAQDLVAWAKALAFSGASTLYEPKQLRHRLMHVAARIVTTGRRTILRLQASWPWADELAEAFSRLRTLPSPI